MPRRPVQAKQLTIALNWDRSLPEGAGKPLAWPIA